MPAWKPGLKRRHQGRAALVRDSRQGTKVLKQDTCREQNGPFAGKLRIKPKERRITPTRGELDGKCLRDGGEIVYFGSTNMQRLTVLGREGPLPANNTPDLNFQKAKAESNAAQKELI